MTKNSAKLLSFCALNRCTIYEKADVLNHTWKHLGMKHWHHIDYIIIMHQVDRPMCYDVVFNALQSAGLTASCFVLNWV